MSKTVLFIDDEREFTRILTQMLAANRTTLIPASNAVIESSYLTPARQSRRFDAHTSLAFVQSGI